MASTVIGRIVADLITRTANFSPGIKRAQRDLVGLRKSVAQTQRGMRMLSGSLVGFAGSVAGLNFGGKVLRQSGDFEAAMKRVEAISGASETAVGNLSSKALELGRTTQFTAAQSADSIETLVKNGLSVQQVMEGALDASLTLAAATGGELARSADIATDVMLSFKKEAGDLQEIVNGITGTTLKSKFGIEDYAAALGQAGGAVGALGVEVEDFNTTLAATSNAFASGSDAGTSFKTFVASLAPISNTAKRTIKELGLEFFDANGNLRSMADIAGELETAFAGLTEAQRVQVAQTIFGRDAMRTALALAATGKENFEELAAAIQKTDALEQARKRLEGYNGMLHKLRSATEGVLLRMGFEGGLLGVATKLGEKLTGLVSAIGRINPEILKWTAIIGGGLAAATALAAAIGAVSTAVTVFAAPVVVLTAKIALLAAAVSAAVAAVVASGVTWKTLADVVFPYVQRALELLGANFGLVFNGITAGALTLAAKVTGAFETLVSGAADNLNLLIRAFNKLPEWMRGGLEVGEIDTSGLTNSVEAIEAKAAEFRGKAAESAKEIARLLTEAVGGPGFVDAWKGNFDGLVSTVKAKTKEAGDWLKENLFEKPGEEGTETVGEQVDALVQRIEAAVTKATKTTGEASEAAKEWGDSIQDTFVDGIARARDFGDVVTSVLDQIREKLIRDILVGGEGGAGGILGAVFGGGGLGGLLGGLFGKPKANGGSVSAGTLYPVNERRMEFFQPATNGRVLPLGPAGGGGGAGDTYINIDARGADAGVASRLEDFARSLPSMIRNGALGAYREEQRRGGL